MTRRVLRLAVAAAAAAALIPTQARALVLGCSASTSNVVFGPVTNVAVQANGNIRITCTAISLLPAPISVALTRGTNSTTYTPRTMRSAAGRTMNYNLYSDAARTVIFGDGTGGSSVLNGSIPIFILGTISTDVPVYGLVPAPPALLTPGSYTDMITVTVTF